MSKYLVTGGCSFIGSHLCDALQAAGHTVRILDDLSTGKRENVPDIEEILVGDVADQNVVRTAMEGVDGCFHLAAIASVQRSNEEWALTHRVNLGGSVNVLEAARTANNGAPVPVVYASSAAVYGDNPDMPLTEAAEKHPLTAYGAPTSSAANSMPGLAEPSTGCRPAVSGFSIFTVRSRIRPPPILA